MEVSVKCATKIIKKKVILDNVKLDMHGGCVYGLQGPNGSGKTMLIRLICGLIRPTFGYVLIDGRQLHKDLDFPSSMGMLIENPAFLPEYTGLRNLELLAQIRSRINVDQIRETLNDVGLDPDDKRKYRSYSLGMKQRLAIAAAIMEKPELIVLDEPTNALDSAGVEQVCALIRRERDRGSLIIVACHDSEILEQVADEIFTVSEGTVEKKVSR